MELLKIPITLEQDLVGQSKKSNQKEKTLFSFFKTIFTDKDIRTSHCVGHSKIKELDNNDLFYKKQMIENLEAELTGSLKEISNTDNLAVEEWEYFDKSITKEAKAINEMKDLS